MCVVPKPKQNYRLFQLTIANMVNLIVHHLVTTVSLGWKFYEH